jgi:hypothetical protein
MKKRTVRYISCTNNHGHGEHVITLASVEQTLRTRSKNTQARAAGKEKDLPDRTHDGDPCRVEMCHRVKKEGKYNAEKHNSAFDQKPPEENETIQESDSQVQHQEEMVR